MGSIEVVSMNTGKPRPLQYNKKEVSSGIFKSPVNGPLFLSLLNLDGDGQADLVHHGGRDKAVCVYCYEHYPYWEEQLHRRLESGAFGENLTIRGITEQEVRIGDTFQFGEAVVQVSQPRQPCYKISARYGVPDMQLKVQETGFTGFYFRVLKEGNVSKSDSLILISHHPKAVTIADANRVMFGKDVPAEEIQKILDVDALSESWRDTLSKRLDRLESDTVK
ncbi:MOSC domain-containing protein [Paenibacillus sp. M1]|uniref:MOSC domain-containing protein n=1 Tax=Paenibacillus haidiansis TaxID=1574488 RepID=A0ABU7VKD3_9BACL